MARLMTWQGPGPYSLFLYIYFLIYSFFHAIFSLFNVQAHILHLVKKKHKLRIQVLVSEMAPQRPLELLKRPLKFLFGINIATYS